MRPSRSAMPFLLLLASVLAGCASVPTVAAPSDFLFLSSPAQPDSHYELRGLIIGKYFISCMHGFAIAHASFPPASIQTADGSRAVVGGAGGNEAFVRELPPASEPGWFRRELLPEDWAVLELADPSDVPANVILGDPYIEKGETLYIPTLKLLPNGHTTMLTLRAINVTFTNQPKPPRVFYAIELSGRDMAGFSGSPVYRWSGTAFEFLGVFSSTVRGESRTGAQELCVFVRPPEDVLQRVFSQENAGPRAAPAP